MLHINKPLKEDKIVSPNLAVYEADEAMPKNALNEKSVPAEVAYRLIKDELIDEGNARQNLATFCQTYMAVSYTHLDVYKRQVGRYRQPGCGLYGR